MHRVTARRSWIAGTPAGVLSVLLIGFLVVLGGPLNQAQAADAPDIQIKVEHLIFTPSDVGLDGFAIYQFSNAGTTDAPQLELELPPETQGFQAVQGLDEGSYEVQGNHLVSNQPLAAGETREIMFYFSVPWEAQNYHWSQTALYPTDLLFVLVPEGQLELNGIDLTRGEIQAIDSTDYRQFYTLDLTVDQSVAAQVVPGSGTTGETDNGGTTTSEPDRVLNKGFHGGQANVELWMRMTGRPDHFGWAGVVGFGAGILLIGGLITGARTRWFHRIGERGAERTTPTARKAMGLTADDLMKLSGDELNQHREALMKSLVQLELAHRRGETDEPSYGQQRKDLLKQLARIELAQKGQNRD